MKNYYNFYVIIAALISASAVSAERFHLNNHSSVVAKRKYLHTTTTFVVPKIMHDLLSLQQAAGSNDTDSLQALSAL